ncbi:MAG: hypothetical protein JW915_03280 [Chitinispirillaceae bacterium]|nr:hypothetical protein [Chitinispirillaceae bacterium]
MKQFLIAATALFLFTTPHSYGQELVYEFESDPAIYDGISSTFRSVIVAPENLTPQCCIDFYFVMRRKDNGFFDIFARTGKIGSFSINNSLLEQYRSGSSSYPCVTQKIFDTDDGWEIFFQNRAGALVIDDDGTTLFRYGDGIVNDTDSNWYYSAFGFDGNSTYICIEARGITNYAYKLYRFRTNISPTKPYSLSKKAAGPNTMMFFGASAGDYRISLLPSGGGKTSVQLFDMMGRQVFESQVDNITRPFSITIPAEQTSRTPFITRVRDKNGSVVKKEIPVR